MCLSNGHCVSININPKCCLNERLMHVLATMLGISCGQETRLVTRMPIADVHNAGWGYMVTGETGVGRGESTASSPPCYLECRQ